MLWNELAATPDSFTLYGGTAIALQLGHRFSIDFDFFSPMPFRPFDLMAEISYLDGGIVRQSAANTLTVGVEREGPVLLSFFGGLKLGQALPSDTASGPGINVASLLDLAGTKVAVVTQRAEIKDYVDIHALLFQAQLPLAIMLSAAAIIYGNMFNPLTALKAISYHDDEALKDLPLSIRRDLVAAVRTVDVNHLPILESVRLRADDS